MHGPRGCHRAAAAARQQDRAKRSGSDAMQAKDGGAWKIGGYIGGGDGP